MNLLFAFCPILGWLIIIWGLKVVLTDTEARPSRILYGVFCIFAGSAIYIIAVLQIT